MPVTVVKNYQINIVSRAVSSLIYMHLYDTSDNFFANIAFSDDNENAPAPRISSGRYHIFYPRKDYMAVVDLLRNEKPVFLEWIEHDDAPPSASLRTRAEPVGAHEVEEL